MANEEIFESMYDNYVIHKVFADLKAKKIKSIMNMEVEVKKVKTKKLFFIIYNKKIKFFKFTINESLYVTEMLLDSFNLKDIVKFHALKTDNNYEIEIDYV